MKTFDRILGIAMGVTTVVSLFGFFWTPLFIGPFVLLVLMVVDLVVHRVIEGKKGWPWERDASIKYSSNDAFLAWWYRKYAPKDTELETLEKAAKQKLRRDEEVKRSRLGDPK